MPGYEKIPHRFLATVHALVGRIDGAKVILQDHFHRWVRQHQLAQVAHVCRGPGALGRVAEPVPQKERFESVTGSGAIVHGVGASAAQVPDRLVGGIRHIHRREVAGTQQAGELFGIPPVGLDFVSGLFRDQRGGHDHAGDTELLEPPSDDESARPRLIADVQRGLPVAPDPAQELFQRVEVVGDRPRLAHFTGAPPFGHGCGDRFFVDIEPDVDFSFVHMVCLSVRLFHCGDSERVSAHYGVVLADRPSRATRVL